MLAGDDASATSLEETRWPLQHENSISDARNRHNNIMERVKAHADSIKDKVVNYFRWEGQGLALVADQHGFSKQLVDFYSRAPVWDYQDEEAIEKWNAIMKDAVAVSEQALVQGVGIGPPKQLEAPSAGEKGSKNAPANTGEVDGIEVYESVLVGHISRDEELISVATQFVPELDRILPPQQGQEPEPRISATEVTSAARPPAS